MQKDVSKPGRPVEWDERSPELFSPDLLLASQYADRVRPAAEALSPERRLMAAVLEDAVHVYRVHAAAASARQRCLFEEAEAWIESEDRSWIFSFESICDHLGIDPDYLRRGLRAHKARVRRPPGPPPPVSLRAEPASIGSPEEDLPAARRA